VGWGSVCVWWVCVGVWGAGNVGACVVNVGGGNVRQVWGRRGGQWWAWVWGVVGVCSKARCG